MSSKAKNIIKTQQQPSFPLKYDNKYGPYSAITSVVQSYKRDFINLLLTSPGEWPMSPEIGIGLKHYLFEFKNSEKLTSLGPTIKYQLKRHLPVVELKQIKFDYNDEDLDNNKVRVVLAYTILDSTGFVTKFEESSDNGLVSIEDVQEVIIQSSDLFERRNAILSSVTQL